MKPATQHMIDVLKTTIRALGFTNRAVEQRLGVSRGYLTRLFSGVMELRFDQVTEIAEILGVEPEEILRLAFPPVQKPASPAALRLREALGVEPSQEPSGEGVEGSSALERELERIVARTFRKMFTNLEQQ